MSKWWIWLALGATLIAVYFTPSQDQDALSLPARSGAAATPGGSTASAAGSAAAVASGRPDLRIVPRDGEDWGNLFGAPPAPVAAVAAPLKKQPTGKVKPLPPQPPQAPPLPFQYLGRFVDGTRVAYFLQWNERNLVLRPGETVDRLWKLEQAQGGLLTFTYLPLNQKQSLAVGDVN
jgi:hypothetical protein